MYLLNQILFFLKQIAQLVLVPAHCASCKIMMEHDFPLCPDCMLTIRRLIPTELAITPTKKMTVFALGAYEGPLAQLVRAKQNRSLSAAQQLGVLLAEHIRGWNHAFDYIVPVPLHWRRYAMRGYNQTEVMAKEVARTRGVAAVRIAKRTKHTAYQMSCSAQGRTLNVQDVFALSVKDYAAYQGKHILLIDDLMTTGATLTAVGRALLPLKPASVSALVACKVV